MSKTAVVTLVVVIIAIAGGAYVLGQRNAPAPAPQSLMGNVAAAITDKVNQVGDQSKADADKQSADQHMDNVKESLGISPSAPSSNSAD